MAGAIAGQGRVALQGLFHVNGLERRCRPSEAARWTRAKSASAGRPVSRRAARARRICQEGRPERAGDLAPCARHVGLAPDRCCHHRPTSSRIGSAARPGSAPVYTDEGCPKPGLHPADARQVEQHRSAHVPPPCCRGQFLAARDEAPAWPAAPEPPGGSRLGARHLVQHRAHFPVDVVSREEALALALGLRFIKRGDKRGHFRLGLL